MHKPEVTGFFDEPTNTVSYVVIDPATRHARSIEHGAGLRSGRRAAPTGTRPTRSSPSSASNGLTVEWILETHVHADHLSAAPYLKEQLGGQLGIGANITVVQNVFGKIFNAGTEFQRDGSQFDHLFEDGDDFAIGGIAARAIHTPGHTPGLHDLCDRRRRLRRRHAVHARLRHRALRLPGRRRAPALPLDPQDLRPARRDPPVPVPRLQGARPRRVSLGDHGGRGEGATTSTSTRASARTSSSPCAPRATARSACRG